MKYLKFFLILFLLHPLIASGQQRAITVEDLWAMRRISDITVSPDEKWIAYTIKQYDLPLNTSDSDIYMVGTTGGVSKRMTTHPAYDGKPRWSPDGEMLSFISTPNARHQSIASNSDVLIAKGKSVGMPFSLYFL